jgi:hypothetical protein
MLLAPLHEVSVSFDLFANALVKTRQAFVA